MWKFSDIEDCYDPAPGNEYLGNGVADRLFTCYYREHLWKVVRETTRRLQDVGRPRIIKEHGGRRLSRSSTVNVNAKYVNAEYERASKRQLSGIKFEYCKRFKIWSIFQFFPSLINIIHLTIF